ncbi:zinc-ribbon domain-containing protein [Candidatus Pelagibacter bacterium]|nr:zinc-ribbon domain-containing protein [Candidatus Pelagibacter bacterium]
MIITCPNCNKKFKIDNSLIPDEGRDLKCGSCNHIWLYKIKEENSKILELKEEIDINDIKTKVDKNNEEIVENKNPLTKIETELNNQKKEKNIEKQKETKISKNTGNKLFSYLIVFIISFVALIILLDTLKNPLIDVFPGLEIILFNLFETLQDIKLFIIDLI